MLLKETMIHIRKAFPLYYGSTFSLTNSSQEVIFLHFQMDGRLPWNLGTFGDMSDYANIRNSGKWGPFPSKVQVSHKEIIGIHVL